MEIKLDKLLYSRKIFYLNILLHFRIYSENSNIIGFRKEMSRGERNYVTSEYNLSNLVLSKDYPPPPEQVIVLCIILK